MKGLLLLAAALTVWAAPQGIGQTEDERHREAIAAIQAEFTAVQKAHNRRLRECPTSQCKLDEKKRFQQENALLGRAKAAEKELHRNLSRRRGWTWEAMAAEAVKPGMGVTGSSGRIGEAAGGAAAGGDKCPDSAYCSTPAGSGSCPVVRATSGTCPDSAAGCALCYTAQGSLFAFQPLAAGAVVGGACGGFGTGAIWVTENREIARTMTAAGGTCASNAKDGYYCTKVDAAKFQQASDCAR